eukprot:g3437.t1
MAAFVDVVSSIEDVVGRALKQVCPAQAVLSKGSVQRISQTNGAEYSSSAAARVFWALFRQQDKVEKKVVICSDFGTEKRVDLVTLNRLILDALPNAKVQKVFSYVGIPHPSSAILCFNSKQHAARQAERGMVGCPKCGKFLKLENSGLEWHAKNVHKIEKHSSAYDAVASAKNALVLYRSLPFTALANESSQNSEQTEHNYDDNLALTKLERYADMTSAQNSPAELELMIKQGKVKRLCHPALDACRSGDMAALKHFVKVEKWDPAACHDRNGSSGLLWAAGGGHLECVKFLVGSSNVDPVVELQKGRRGYAGRNALHWSARNGHLECCQYFIEACGLEIDAPTEDGTTPFHLAVWQNRIPVCSYLVEQGCNPHLLNSYGCNAMLWAGQGPFAEMEMFRFLEDLNVDFNAFNDNGQGVLHKAAQRGKLKVCQWLVNSRKIGGGEDDPGFELLKKHFQRTKTEKSTPTELAEYAGNAELKVWLSDLQKEFTVKLAV